MGIIKLDTSQVPSYHQKSLKTNPGPPQSCTAAEACAGQAALGGAQRFERGSQVAVVGPCRAARPLGLGQIPTASARSGLRLNRVRTSEGGVKPGGVVCRQLHSRVGFIYFYFCFTPLPASSGRTWAAVVCGINSSPCWGLQLRLGLINPGCSHRPT